MKGFHQCDLAPAAPQDTERDRKHLKLLHQKENAEDLQQAERLLKELFMDVDRAKKLQHPQVHEIERE